MTYRIYDKETLQLSSNLEFDENYVDNDTKPKTQYEVGDTVVIDQEGTKHHGKVCVVVWASVYGMYRVEPYNDPYWNNPANLCKLGPYLNKDLKKVKKAKGLSTVYKGMGAETVSTGGSKIGIEELKSLEKSNKRDKSIDDIRNAFSGGVAELISADAPVVNRKKRGRPKNLKSPLKKFKKKV